MGYTTWFKGAFKVTPALDVEAQEKIQKIKDDNGNDGDDRPSYYCGWMYDPESESIEWDGCEKFYAYIEWLEYLIDKVFAPNDYKLNGAMVWWGEDEDDLGLITIDNNKVSCFGHGGRYDGDNFENCPKCKNRKAASPTTESTTNVEKT